MSAEARPNINAVGLVTDIIESIRRRVRGRAGGADFADVLELCRDRITAFAEELSDVLDERWPTSAGADMVDKVVLGLSSVIVAGASTAVEMVQHGDSIHSKGELCSICAEEARKTSTRVRVGMTVKGKFSYVLDTRDEDFAADLLHAMRATPQEIIGDTGGPDWGWSVAKRHVEVEP